MICEYTNLFPTCQDLFLLIRKFVGKLNIYNKLPWEAGHKYLTEKHFVILKSQTSKSRNKQTVGETGFIPRADLPRWKKY